ncbi:transposase [Schlegelella aquatica]|uniref:transposase n=1 Tax=Caldimonas aquatica TaxID=376175 RepID=UPI0037524973
MARLARLAAPGLPHAVVQRGHNRQPVFLDEEDYRLYLTALREAVLPLRTALHAYVLVPGEVWMLLTPSQPDGLSRTMQAVGRRYAAAFNRRHARTGTLWDGRFRAGVVEPARLVTAMLAVETLPQRRGLVGQPDAWRWSSLAHHLGRRHDTLIHDAAPFWALGNTPFDREAAYARRLEEGLSGAEAEALEACALKGWVWGSAAFVAEVERATQRRAQPRPRGRPRKQDGDQVQGRPRS